ncbi:hypothetical protein C8J57DRAFT_1599991 [Mycena rebaudengoi]|nr:hypothetical protein C8J57DRAFT_1599991 [Mycena rebaudengoi]
MSNNPAGHNGHDNGTPPHDLPRILQEFATAKIPLPERCEILAEKHHYVIKLAKLKTLNKKHNIISARRPPPLHISRSLISKQMAENPTGTNGPNTIQKRVELIEGIPLARDLFHEIMHVLDPGGSQRRFPTKRTRKPRTVLTDVAVFYEIHLDGHEKLNFKALRMGKASIDVYGGKCHGSGYIVLMEVVPNARCGITCGHLYLDLVEETGYMPIQLTVDGGTEVKYMTDLHEYLRATYTPNITAPKVVALKSTDNLPIESVWNQLLQFTGHDLKAVILEGRSSSIINIGLELHMLLFQWLWPKIVKRAINTFVQYWNNHKTCKQREKWLPSGVAPKKVYENPLNYGFKHAGKPVPREVVQELRKMLPKSREECMRWVPEEFDVQAWAVYKLLGSPTLSITNGWDIFTQMLLKLQ